MEEKLLALRDEILKLDHVDEDLENPDESVSDHLITPDFRWLFDERCPRCRIEKLLNEALAQTLASTKSA